MPTNTLDKIRHSLSCVAVLFGLLGIFVFASFSPSYARLYLGGLAAPLYIVLFLSMRLPPGVFIQSIIRFYHWAAYHLWNVFSGAGPVCLTVLYNAFSGPEPGWPSYQGNFSS